MDQQRLREAVELAAAKAVQDHAAQLCTSVVARVLAELEPVLSVAPGSSPTDLLNAAIASVQDATSQADILTSLLDGAEKFSERCGLLVTRGANAAGWQCRGISLDVFRRTQLDCSRGLSERAIRTKAPAAGSIFELDSNFASQLGEPKDGNVILLPLAVRDRVVALLFADGGAKGAEGLDVSAVEILVRSTVLWLETLSMRKVSADQPAQAPAQVVSASGHGVAAADPTPHAPFAGAANPRPENPARGAAHSGNGESHDEAHSKARRFAKLLVEEIKLYNQGKVSEGRQNRDLYSRLREDIEKSRAAYNKRFGDAIQDVDYFTGELVRILADNDRSLLGSNFPA